LHPQEQAALQTNVSDALNLTTQLTILWSCKEAMFKWWGDGNIDFSTQMILDQMPIAKDGILPVRFIEKSGTEHELLVHYKVMNQLCLVWVCS
jgi:phosphopantetheinyl transferase (holo-ACP synthase)